MIPHKNFEEERFYEKCKELKSKFDELRVQLALGKAETKEMFEKQKKELLGI
mgnify:CR=1 FL=1